MAEEESAQKPRKKHKVLQVLIVLLVVIIVGFVVFRLVLKSKLNARLDAVREAGYPATCAELDAWYAIPESAENAADTIRDSFSHYNKWEEDQKRKLLPIVGQAELPLRTEPLTEETKAVVTQYLADNQKALELLYKGAAIEHSRYPVDLGKGFEALMPHLSDLRTGARMLELEAILHAENGKPEKVVDSIESTFGLARSLSREPILVSQLVRIACQALAVSALEHAINRTEFTDEQLVKFSQILVNAEGTSAMSRAFVGERCAGLSIFKTPSSQTLKLINGGSSPLGVVGIALYKFAGLADMDAAIYLDIMNDYVEIFKLPSEQRRKAADAADTRFEKTSRIHVLLHIIMPALSRVTTIDVRGIAQLRTARAALAIERYRLAAGKLPDTLAELVPAYLDAVPKDPFDGKDLRYKKLEPGFVVYSIGEDGSDDGGKEKPQKRTDPPEKWDVTFIVLRKESQGQR
jgi:type II secretory pathway pseudopilin PulG